jgi:SAM-dependent methyltransferase
MGDGWFDLAVADHFWIEWRFEALRRLADHLPDPDGRVLEVGCGRGVFRQQLEEQLGYTVDACDLNITALERASPGRGKLLVYDIHDRDPSLLRRYSAVFLMDVIEHIADDAAFLRSAALHARLGSVVIINVPASPWLYSRYDEAVGHVRRYSRATLTELLRTVGLRPLAITYWGLSLVPLLLARKAMASVSGSASVVRRGFRPPGAAAHALLKRLKTLELSLLRSPVYGASLMAISQVPSR